MRNSLVLAREVVERCERLSRFSEDANSIRRTFLCPAMHGCHEEIISWLAPLGVGARVDAVGNLRIDYSGLEPDAPRLLIGSHLDTVPNAGAYDGILGVVLAIALLQAIEGRRLPFAIEVVGFSEEEGVRFGMPFLGSRALVGRCDDQLLSEKDADEISVRAAIKNFGLDPLEIAHAAVPSDVVGYLEFHIEQGPVLENLGHPLGLVEAIVGQTRLELTYVGSANHAGTTPMNLRRDALAAAAEWISCVERYANGVPGLVASVGSLQVKPGAGNVIPGEARMSLDVRHPSDSVRESAVKALRAEGDEIADRRGLRASWEERLDQRAVPMDAFLVGQIAEAMRKTGCEPFRMPSGAGHDAMIMAERVPSAMVFLRTPGGISHHPDESVSVEDVAKAIECGCNLLEQLASSEEFLRKKRNA